MKALFIVFNQAITEEIMEALEENNIRGFTKFNDLQGRGSEKGDPHMGTHTWPALNNGILTILSEDQEATLTQQLQKINEQAEAQGLKAFSWAVDSVVS